MAEIYKFDQKALDFASRVLHFSVDDLPPNELYFLFDNDPRLANPSLRVGDTTYTNGDKEVSKNYLVLWKGQSNGTFRPLVGHGTEDKYIFDQKAVEEAEKILGYSLNGLEGVDLYFVFNFDPDVSKDSRFVARSIIDIDKSGTHLRSSYSVWMRVGREYWDPENRISQQQIEGNGGFPITRQELKDLGEEFDREMDREFERANLFSSSGNCTEDIGTDPFEHKKDGDNEGRRFMDGQIHELEEEMN